MAKRVWLSLAASALLILYIGQFTDIDLTLTRLLYDYAGQRFPLRHHWFAEGVNHGILKNLLVILAVAVVAPMVVDLLRPIRALSPWYRVRLRIVALSAVLVPLVVSSLKRISVSHCPWDLVEFGGDERYVRLLEAALPHAPAGHCMPAGHASSALWLVSLAVFWLPHRPRMAALVGALMLVLGFGVGWIQQLRGAHFLTHTLWTMWLACAIVSALYAVMLRRRLRSGALEAVSSTARGAAEPGATPLS